MSRTRNSATKTTDAPAVKAPAVADFIASTWLMMNDGHEEIGWSSDGKQVVVSNAERLGEHVLPRYFKHGQFASWVRALNAYDFKKVSAGRWQHPSFSRNRSDLLPSIRRKPAPVPASRRRDASATATSTSTALVVHPEKALLTAQQQQWLWMQAEMANLQGELLSIRREEFQQRFDFVRLIQILLKKGVAANFLPGFQGMGSCKVRDNRCKLLESKCKILELRSSSDAPLSEDAAAAVLQRAIRFRKSAAVSEAPSPPMSASSDVEALDSPPPPPLYTPQDTPQDTADAPTPFVPLSAAAPAALSRPAALSPLRVRSPAHDSDAMSDDGSVGSLPMSLPTVPSPSRVDIELEELDLDYDELLRQGPPRWPSDERRVHEEADSMSDGSASTPDAGGGRRGGGQGAPSGRLAAPSSLAACSKQQRVALRTRQIACALASMPQLPKSTAALPPEGSRPRAQLDAAINLAFKQLTISAT